MSMIRKAAEKTFLRNLIPIVFKRDLNLTSPSYIKEIRETKQGKITTYEGISVPSIREPFLLKTEEQNDACPICSAQLDVKHTDVLILSQFLRSDGCMLPRRITGLCKMQQKRMSSLVSMAQKAGLMPNLAPANSNRDPKRRYKWKKFNTYYDESSIKPPKEIKL